jgi:DNA-binding Lrp family transcriptional regulator
MDQLDRDILNLIQSDFPLEARPYLAVAAKVGLTEAEVLRRVQALKDEGVIRRIGGNVWAGRVGYVSTLCAARVAEDKVDEFAAAVNELPGVTHNYLRDDDSFNVWFTLISPSAEEQAQTLADLEARTGVAVRSFPAVRTFKIKVDFEV